MSDSESNLPSFLSFFPCCIAGRGPVLFPGLPAMVSHKVDYSSPLAPDVPSTVPLGLTSRVRMCRAFVARRAQVPSAF